MQHILRKIFMLCTVVQAYTTYTHVNLYTHNPRYYPLFLGLYKFGYCEGVPSSHHKFAYEDYFNTRKIGNSIIAQQMLAQEQVYPHDYVKTEDGASLETYARILDNPDYTFILPAGFSPGKLFGMTTFCKLLPENSNLFLFHARDRGNSTSPTLRNALWRYGRDHWRDVAAMIEHAHNKNHNAPIYIMGICAGAFHTLHAARNMGNTEITQYDDITKYNVQGIIADSTMTSNWEMAKTAIPMELTKNMPSIISLLTRCGLHTIRYGIYKPATWALGLEQDTHITPDMTEHIPVQVCYMHGENDPYSHVENIQNLKGEQDRLHTFTSEQGRSIHATIHLKQRELYQSRINQFIEDRQKTS